MLDKSQLISIEYFIKNNQNQLLNQYLDNPVLVKSKNKDFLSKTCSLDVFLDNLRYKLVCDIKKVCKTESEIPLHICRPQGAMLRKVLSLKYTEISFTIFTINKEPEILYPRLFLIYIKIKVSSPLYAYEAVYALFPKAVF